VKPTLAKLAVPCLRARAHRAWCAARSTSAAAGRRRAAAFRPGWQMRPSARLRWHLRAAGRFRPRCRRCGAPWPTTAACAPAAAGGRSDKKRLAGSLRHAHGELAAPLAAHMGLGSNWVPHLYAHCVPVQGLLRRAGLLAGAGWRGSSHLVGGRAAPWCPWARISMAAPLPTPQSNGACAADPTTLWPS